MLEKVSSTGESNPGPQASTLTTQPRKLRWQ